MKIFQKHRGFGRYLVSYLCVLLLPLTAFLLFSSHFYLKVYRNEVIQQNQSHLERLQSDFDANILSLSAIAGQISTSDAISAWKFHSEFTVYADIQKILQGYTATHPFLKTTAFYTDASPNTVYTDSGTFNLSLFRQYQDGTKELNLQERLNLPRFRNWWLPEEMRWPKLDQRPELEYAVPVPNLPGSYMLFTFQESEIARMMEFPDSPAFLFNSDMQAIFQSEEADERMLEELSKHMEEKSGYVLLDDDRFLLFCRSQDTRLLFTRIISKSVMLEPVVHLQQVLTILTVILMLVGGVAVYAFSIMGYRPIRRLDSLNARMPMDVPENLYGVERAGFLIERMDERYETLEKEACREKQLYRLIHGRGGEALEDKLAKVGICFSSPYLRVILFFWDSGKEPEEAPNVLVMMDSIFSGQYEIAGMEYLENNCYLFILGYEEENEELLRSKLMTAASCFDGDSRGRCRITVGGPVSELSQVNRSYTQALMATRTADSAQTIRFFNSPSMGKVRFLYPKIELDSLYHAVVNADGEKVKLITDILTDMVRANAHNSFVAFSLGCDVLNTILRGLEELKPDAGVGGYYTRLANLCDPSDISSYLGAIQEVQEKVSDIIGRKPAENARDEAIGKILSFINDNCENEELCASYVADHFQMSMSNLSHQFKALTGRNVSDYIAEKKMQFAKKLLRTTDIPISDIAVRLGYNQTSSFIRKFKQCENRTPNEYRIACQESGRSDEEDDI